MAIGMLGSFMALIMSRKATTLAALILTPVAFALLGGFAADLGAMSLDGVKSIAPTGVMLAFAILYFSIMSDAGMFDPLIRLIVRVVHGDPMRIVVGSGVLALVISLDGDGSTTYIICCAAMLPLYRQMGLDPLVLTCLLMLSCGITNLTPWGGPAAKVATALNVDVGDIFPPLVPGMLLASAFVILLSLLLGRRERRRLGKSASAGEEVEPFVLHNPTARPDRFWVNLALTAALLTALFLGTLPTPILFMIGSALALTINYPGHDEQKDRLVAHAPSILRVIAVVFAAGIFVGVLEGTKMSSALAHALVEAIPPQLGSYLAPITGLIALPFTFFMPNEAFFFGVLPILSKAAAFYGIEPVEMARAALVASPVHLLSPIVPSTHLLVGLAGVDFGRHQRFTMKWAIITSCLILGGCLLTGAVPLRP